MTEPLVTVVVVPRERFTFTRESLENIYKHTEIPFNLVYVDGNSPPKEKSYLEEQAKEKGFKLLRTDYFLYPNRARNMGLRHVNTQYVVFIDNDVRVTQGWLKHLVECAEETGADVVGPLTGIGTLEQGTIHNAGGEVGIVEKPHKGTLKRRVHEKMYYHNRRLPDVREELQRIPCSLAEFHCMLVRTSIFEKTGPLDERLLNTREHLDFCMIVAGLGGQVYCEPKSYVTYIPHFNFLWSDLHFYMLRWSNAWELETLQHFSKKWKLGTEDEFFQERYDKLGWRREKGIIRPMAERIGGKKYSVWVAKILRQIDKALNPYLTDRFAREELKRQQKPQDPPTPSLPELTHQL